MSFLLIVTEDGYGKRIPVSDIPRQGRGRQEVQVSSEPVAAALVAPEGQEVAIASAGGKVERIAVADIPIRRRRVLPGGKLAKGVAVIGLDPGDRVAAVGPVASEPLVGVAETHAAAIGDVIHIQEAPGARIAEARARDEHPLNPSRAEWRRSDSPMAP